MERIVAITAIVFGGSGLIILALAWLVQQRRPRLKAGRAKKDKAQPPGTREKPEAKEVKVEAREKPVPDAVYYAAASAPVEKEEGPGQSHLNEKEEASGENLQEVTEDISGEKLQEVTEDVTGKKLQPVKYEQRTGGRALEGLGSHWYIGVFPARALIEELSLLNKLRDILRKTGEIHEAIRAVKPDFNQESKIAEFIYENNLQYFETVSREEGTTVYIREGRQCFADNDRCIYYKGYVWLNPDWVDFDLSSRKP